MPNKATNEMPVMLMLPWPPSSNEMYNPAKGTKYLRLILSENGRNYQANAKWHLRLWGGKPYQCAVAVTIVLHPPSYHIMDIDNRIKPVMDVLVKNSVLADDSIKYVRRIVVELGKKDPPHGGVEVKIEPL